MFIKTNHHDVIKACNLYVSIICNRVYIPVLVSENAALLQCKAFVYKKRPK